MNIFRPLVTLAAALYAGCGLGSPPQDGPAAPKEPADVIFGIRLGAPLATQFPACMLDGDRPRRLREQPCWRPDPIYKGARSVLLGEALVAELGVIDVRRVREVGGVVVEVEAEFAPADVARVERRLRRHKGPPTASEAFERDSRLFGISRFMSHTWQGEGATLHFSERSSADRGQVRAFVDDWAEQHAKEEKAWRERLPSGR